MIVDMLRSAYSTGMRFDLTQPSRIIQVRWYKAALGAPVLPFQTAFSSLNWVDSSAREADDGSLGEVGGAPRAWANGAAPGGVGGGGPCGSPAEFLHGQVLGPSAPRGYVLPVCCTVVLVGPCVTTMTYPNPAFVTSSSGGPEGINGFGGSWTGATLWGAFFNWVCFNFIGFGPIMIVNLCNFLFVPLYQLTPIGYNPVTRVYRYRDDVGTAPGSFLGSIWSVSPV